MELLKQKISENPKQAFFTGLGLATGACLLLISELSFVFEALRYTAIWFCLGYSVWNLLSLQTKEEHHPKAFGVCVAVTSLIPWLIMCFVVFVLFAPITLETSLVNRILHNSMQVVKSVSVVAALVFLGLSAVKSKHYFACFFVFMGLWTFAHSFESASALLATDSSEWLLYFVLWLLPCICGAAANIFFWKKQRF